MPILRRILLFIMPLLWSLASWATAYDAPLPPQLASDPNMCAWLDCRAVSPGADSFSPRKGNPPYVEAYRNGSSGKQLLGYVFLSTDIVDTPGYSGKPIVTLIGMDTKGKITGLRILRHSEPILLVGIPENKLTAFINQYIGRLAGTPFEIGKDKTDGGGLDAISGATVTVIAENQVISRCIYEVARQVGIIKAKDRPQARLLDTHTTLGWDALLAEGSLQRLTVKSSEVGEPDNGEPYIDIYFAYLNTPAIGRSILGDDGYSQLMQSLKPNEHALLLVANGQASFKGSGFVRGGIFDRIQVKQELDSFTFRDTDYLNLYGIRAKGAPAFQESGIFILRNKSFSAAYPWQLVFLAHKLDKETGAKTFANFTHEYWVPATYLQGGRPQVSRPDPMWLKMWKQKAPEIAIFVSWLLLVTLFYALRDNWVRRAKRRDKRWVQWPKMASWLFAVGFVGFFEMAQPSVTQIMTWLHSVIFEWRWELFLSDPFIFIFWWFIIATTLIWGRGLFCGWLCPFGSMSELLYKLAGRLGLKRWQGKLPKPLHDKLKWLKYGVFAALVGTSFVSMGLAEKLAEVEPFKTTFLVGVLHRAWPFVLFWTVLVGISLFIERPFCKYLCPLGAGLAIPSWFRLFGLKRKPECTSCHACAVGCGSQAIDAQGRIDQKECLLCLDCMIMYYDEHACPPLSQERKRRQKAGEPLTPVGKDGHYIPIKKV